MSTATSTLSNIVQLHGRDHEITGRNIAHVARTAHERAILGAELVDGTVRLIRPTLLQAAEIVGVCPAYVRWAKQATPARRREMAASPHGLTSPRLQLRLPTPITDADLDRVPEERLWAALARAEAANGNGGVAANRAHHGMKVKQSRSHSRGRRHSF